ncbi:MAG: hybrid sensor histidine kinase/response regulator, partial [Paracoccus sp. BP8]
MATKAGPSVKILGTSFSQEADPFTAAVQLTPMPMLITNPRLPDNPIVFAGALQETAILPNDFIG